MNVISLHFSPRSQRAGLAVAAKGRIQVSVCVLPKLWRPDSAPSVREIEWQGDRLSVVGHELDTVIVRTDAARAAVIEALLQNSAQEERLRREDEGSPLVALGVPPTDRLPLSPSTATASLSDLLALQQRTSGALNARSRQRIDGKQSSERALMPLVRLEFVSEMERRVRALRSGYREVSDSLTTVRGRISERALAMHLSSSDPRLECWFDDFTSDTPLARVLATALDVVASGTTGGLFFADRLLGTAPERALHLRRGMTAVRSMPHREAERTAVRLRLDRLSRDLEYALHLAVLVLRGHGFLPRDDSGTQFPCFELEIPTAKLWEDVIHSVLEAAIGDVMLSRHTRVSPPWDGGRSADSHPDWLLSVGDTVWCVDAKYKEAPANRSPSRDDLYQLYAYSHLATWNGVPPGRLALVYPDRARLIKRWSRYVRNPKQTDCPTLDTLSVPFPTPSDVASATDWCRYVKMAGTGIYAALTGMETHPAPESAAALVW
jgi:5-methylcytosine-specific restriction endonuclease McrBC regulatory subunit McrC